MVSYANENHHISIRQALVLFNISSSVYYYTPKPNEDGLIADLLLNISKRHNRCGFWMMFHRLRRLGYLWNHKKVYRIYTSLKLNLRSKHKRRLPTRIKEPLLQPIAPNVTWSMDFMHDTLFNGKNFRTFNIIDDFNREVLNIILDISINSLRVIRELEKLIEWRGKPENCRYPNC